MTTSRSVRALGATASLIALVLASPALAQTVPPNDDQDPGPFETPAGGETGGDTTSPVIDSAIARTDADAPIIVTAQRRAELLQDVPISISAFSAEALERQQIENASDLQLNLPNVTFTKTNFTGSSFTIRGIGDLCVGFSCDSATGIHVNDMPLTSTRLFETEYFDLERIEVLRGPQGTLYGRNATSGVINFITARPNLNRLEVAAQAEYGNFDSIKLNGMVNLPVTDWVGIRLAGYYLNRGGYTENVFTGNDIDDRDLYAIRGTIRFQPSVNTTLDIIGYYFREDDQRSRIQKQLCATDPTGILGCRPDRLAFETVNGNSTLAAILSSREALPLLSGGLYGGVLPNPGLTSIYGPDTFFGGIVNPADLRVVNIDFEPTYFAEEYHIQGKLDQQLGTQFSLHVTGGYTHSEVDSRTDYNLVAGNPLGGNVGLLTLAGLAQLPGAAFGGSNPFTAIAGALIPGGPLGNVCTSEANTLYSGIYGGFVNRCTPGSTDYDRSQSENRQYVLEAHVNSDLDGPFNFLIGGIYLDSKTTNGNYFVNSFGLDYASGLLGAATTIGQRFAGNTGFPNVFLAPPFFNSETAEFRLKSYGIFGEVYVDITDRLTVTGGLRYSNDDKEVSARAPILSWAAPIGLTDATQSPFIAAYDADASRPGNQLFANDQASFDEITGRFVIDYDLSPDSMIYASYSRGYKSGGINPPIDPIFDVPRTFAPEIINAFEIGTRNMFMNGAIQLNASAFYYDYGGLQLSRIVARTSVNDNTDAEVYGIEIESLVRPDPSWLFNFSLSMMDSEISDLQLIDPRDVSGGRSDAVIIKDLTNASNCVVTGPNAAATNLLVGAFNSALGLRPPVPVPGTNTTGAFSICQALAATIANPSAPLRGLFGVPTGPLPFNVSSGVPIDVSGNELPQAPNFKFTAGAQHTWDFTNGMSLVARADVTYTGEFFTRAFNTGVDRVEGFEVVNAQIQLNGVDQRWFVRAFVQNLTDNDAITGHYVTDQSSGLFTNVFTLEPRRYGVAAGVRF